MNMAGAFTEGKRVMAISSSLAIAAALSLAAATPAGTAEFAKYFNPFQEKGYRNESQDRIIKKHNFKAGTVSLSSPAINKENGIFASINSENIANDAVVESLLCRTEVNGLAVLLPWRLLEPVEDEFNWQPLDHLITLVQKHDKTLILRVSTCAMDSTTGGEENAAETFCDTPKWVFDSGAKSLHYADVNGKSHQLPIFWDSNYLALWRNFVKALGVRYDKNPAIHSVGITGGGIAGSTSPVPAIEKTAVQHSGQDTASTTSELENTLKQEYGMNQRQIVAHWKYVADIFPKAFETTRLNFDIDPPTAGRAGQDALDEIVDYLIYRYGQRIYLTRQNINNTKHGFDQYRLFLKFRKDTLTGYQLASTLDAQALQKLSQLALNDGISFVEVPGALLISSDSSITEPLQYLSNHVGYQIVAQHASIPRSCSQQEPLRLSLSFLNLGCSAPLRPSRSFDKDSSASYRIAIELRDASGKPAVFSLHTPPTPTNQWLSGQTVTYEEELKMPALASGEYSVFLWLVDSELKRKLQLLDAVSHDQPTPSYSVPLGKIQILPTGGGAAVGATTSTTPQ